MDKNRNTDSQKSVVDVMLEFVRASVQERDPVISQDIEIDWDKLMDISSEQGLLAWVWDGICKMPINHQPDRITRINMSLSAQEIVDRYFHQREALREMIEICEQNNVRLLLLKGISLAPMYPKPELRPSGDIDIYLFDDYNKGNELLAKSEIIVKPKHSSFIFHDVTIENHRTFFMAENRTIRKIDLYIKSQIVDSRQTLDGFYVMPTEVNLIYLVTHAVRHMRFFDGLSARTVIDIVMFINQNRAELYPINCFKVIDDLKLSKPFELLLSVGEKFIGKEMNEYHRRNKVSKRDIASLFNLLTSVNGVTMEGCYECSYVKKIILYIKQASKRLWIYHYTLSSFFEIITMERIHFSRFFSFTKIHNLNNTDD